MIGYDDFNWFMDEIEDVIVVKDCRTDSPFGEIPIDKRRELYELLHDKFRVYNREGHEIKHPGLSRAWKKL